MYAQSLRRPSRNIAKSTRNSYGRVGEVSISKRNINNGSSARASRLTIIFICSILYYVDIRRLFGAPIKKPSNIGSFPRDMMREEYV